MERSDTLINLRNQEIAALNSKLAAKDEQIAELDEQLDQTESEAAELRLQLETVIIGNQVLGTTQAETELELPEAADLLNQLKTRRKRSKADLADLEVILEILES